MDRIDIHIEVPSVDFKELSSKRNGTSSKEMRSQVLIAREIQDARFSELPTRCNAQLSSRQIRQFCTLDGECQNLLKASVNEMGLSARAHDKILRVSRTIADLEQCENIESHHINEAINYRMLDRQMWS